MSVTALVSGKLGRDPERKTSKSDKIFATCLLKEGDGDAATWWRILTFSDTVIEELMALKAGDGIAASGSFRAEIYDKDGKQRISFSLFADRVITAKRRKEERSARKGSDPQPHSQMRPFDDGWTP